MTAFEIELPLVHGKAPLSLNYRLHWAEKNRRTELVRDCVHWQAAKHGSHTHVTVALHYATGDRRHRDQDNLVATLKPAIDGLVRSGLIPNDTPEHVTWTPPEIHSGPGDRRLWLTVQPSLSTEDQAWIKADSDFDRTADAADRGEEQ